MAELTVLIADDDRIILENIVRNIDWEALGFKVVGTALNGAQALSLFRELHPDLVVTDVLMPVLSGLDLIREIRAESPHTPVLLISSYEEFAYVRQALFMGAQGYVLKSEIFGVEFRERLARIRDGISQERTSRKAFERGLIEQRRSGDRRRGVERGAGKQPAARQVPLRPLWRVDAGPLQRGG